MLSERVRAVVREEHPVAFVAAMLGFKSVAEFVVSAGQEAKVRPHVLPCYVDAVERDLAAGAQAENVIPYFLLPKIETACSERAPPAEPSPAKKRKTSSATKKKRTRKSERRYAISRR